MNKEKFDNLSQKEKMAIPDDEWRAIPWDIKRGCGGCKFLYSAVSWWCGNEEAHEFRGTNRPDCGHGCPYWEEDKHVISEQKKDIKLRKGVNWIKRLWSAFKKLFNNEKQTALDDRNKQRGEG